MAGIARSYAFRLYASIGCHHCAAAEEYFTSRKMPIQVVIVDPLLAKGIPMALAQDQLQTPIIMSFITQEIIQGYRPDDYDRIIDNYRIRFGGKLSNETSDGSHDFRPTAQFSEETERLSVGAF